MGYLSLIHGIGLVGLITAAAGAPAAIHASANPFQDLQNCQDICKNFGDAASACVETCMIGCGPIVAPSATTTAAATLPGFQACQHTCMVFCCDSSLLCAHTCMTGGDMLPPFNPTPFPIATPTTPAMPPSHAPNKSPCQELCKGSGMGSFVRVAQCIANLDTSIPSKKNQVVVISKRPVLVHTSVNSLQSSASATQPSITAPAMTPATTNDAGLRSLSNPQCYPIVLASYLIQSVSALVVPEQSHKRTEKRFMKKTVPKADVPVADLSINSAKALLTSERAHVSSELVEDKHMREGLGLGSGLSRVYNAASKMIKRDGVPFEEGCMPRMIYDIPRYSKCAEVPPEKGVVHIMERDENPSDSGGVNAEMEWCCYFGKCQYLPRC